MKTKKLNRLLKGLGGDPQHPEYPSSVYLTGRDGSGTGNLGQSGDVALKAIAAEAELARREYRKLKKSNASITEIQRAREKAAQLSKRSAMVKMVAQENARQRTGQRGSKYGPDCVELFDLSKLHTLPDDPTVKGY